MLVAENQNAMLSRVSCCASLYFSFAFLAMQMTMSHCGGNPDKIESTISTAEVLVHVANQSYRVQAISPTLIRVELQGPHGFENRATFLVRNRTSSTPPVHIRNVNRSTSSVVVSTDHYTIELSDPSHLTPQRASTATSGNLSTTSGTSTCKNPSYGFKVQGKYGSMKYNLICNTIAVMNKWLFPQVEDCIL